MRSRSRNSWRWYFDRVLGVGRFLKRPQRASKSSNRSGNYPQRPWGDLVRLVADARAAASTVAAFELARQVPDQDVGGSGVIRTPEDVVRRIGHKVRDLVQEEFWALLLTSAGTVSRQSRITVGTLNCSLVHPRECFHLAVREPAASIIFVHNHPSGNPEPSAEDLAVTRQLVEAGKILGIPVVDHIIIARGSHTSLAERGLIRPESSQTP